MTAIENGTGGEPAEKQPRTPVGARIVRAALVVALANALVKILGLIRIQAVAHQYGATIITDSYWAVFNGVIIALFLIGEECIQPAFLPLFMKDAEERGEKQAWRFASTVLNAQFLVLLLTVSFLMLFPGRVIGLLTTWEEAGGEKQVSLDTAKGFLRVMAPALLGLSLGSVTFILLNARKKFFWAAMGEGSVRAIFAAVIFTLGSAPLLGHWALPVGVLAGSVAKVLTHLPGLFRQLKNYRPVLDFSNPKFRAFLLLMAPLVAGSFYAKVRDNFNQIYVLSKVEEGLMSINFMGRAFTDTLGFLVPYALSVGMFPYLCEMVDRGEHKGLGKLLASSSRFMVFLFMPMAAVMALVSVPIARLLFEMGKLEAADARLVGLVTACYAAALPAYGIERVMMKGFLSNRKTLPLFIIGVIWSTVSMGVCWFLVAFRGWGGQDALMVVALAYVATRILKAITLVAVLKRSIPMFKLGETAAFLLRALALTAACALAAWAARAGVAGLLPLEGLALGRLKMVLGMHLAVIGTAATVTFLTVAWLLRMEELKVAVDWIRPRANKLLDRFRSRR